MPLKLTSPLTIGAALGSGLMAGLFFAFSVCVMKALGQLPPEQGIRAMQSINRAILNPLFFVVFMGTAVICVILLVAALMGWQSPPARFLLAGTVLYLIGVVAVTAVVNVPLNGALEKADPTSLESARLWGEFLVRWTAWNHVRTIAALAALASFVLAVRHTAQP